MKYVVCPKYDTLSNFDDCHVLQHTKRVSKNCTFVEFPNHRQHFRRTECGEPLPQEVTLKSGQTRLYPFKVYGYQSVIGTLKRFLRRPGFTLKYELWSPTLMTAMCYNTPKEIQRTVHLWNSPIIASIFAELSVVNHFHKRSH